MSINHLSHSSINTFISCPHKWYLHYIERISRPVAYWLFSGSCIHNALAYNYEQKVTSRKNLPEEEVIQKFVDTFAAMDPNRGRPEHSSGALASGIEFYSMSPGLVKDINIEVLKVYQRTLAPITQPVVSEFSWSREVAGVKLVGRVDLIDDKSRIVDFKVSKRRPKQDSWHRDRQPTFYAIGMGGPIKFQFQYLLNLATPTVQCYLTERTTEDINHMTNEVLPPIVRSIEAGIFPYADEGSWLCSKRYCDYWNFCRGRK